jgi:phosphoglycolate phosphatase
MHIRGVLFDKDGTLVDFDRTWAPAVDAVLRQLAKGDEDLYGKLRAASGLTGGLVSGPAGGPAGAAHFLPDSPLIGEPTNVFARPWAALLHQPADAAFFAKIDTLLCDATTAHLAPIGDPKSILQAVAARNYRLGLITNDAAATARAHLRKLELERVVEFVAGYDSGFGAKPAPAPVLAFAAATGVAPAQVAVVGDTMIDVATARAAGARAVLVRSGPHPPNAEQEAGADGAIASIADLAAWLECQKP